MGLLLAFAAGAPADIVVAPRRSPELAILKPGGGQLLLSRYRGKVVVVEFLLTTCSHCQEESELLDKLYKQYSPRGLQVLGIAYNTTDPAAVTAFVQKTHATFPVGSSPMPQVIDYLRASAGEPLSFPQVVLIDRKGTIRVQTGQHGDNQMQDERFLRGQIEKLLK
ncbi:MAG: TlpA disulfide reductase family protein [Bryobacteraceae bacterium]